MPRIKNTFISYKEKNSNKKIFFDSYSRYSRNCVKLGTVGKGKKINHKEEI